MAINDVKIFKTPYDTIPTVTQRTEAAATDINPGEPVKRGGTGGNYAIPLANGDPEVSADLVLGIAASASTHTATADGVVQIYQPLQGVQYKCRATDPTNIDTDAELLAIEMDRVTFDLAAGVYTVDEDEGDNADHGLVIRGGDIGTGDLFIEIRDCVTLQGNNDV